MPSDSAPTFEDVVLYANKQGLIGKVDIRKFYDYYGRSNFLYRGALMDWQGKLREWASTQRANVMVTGEIQAILQAKSNAPGEKTFRMDGGQTTTDLNEYMKYLSNIVSKTKGVAI